MSEGQSNRTCDEVFECKFHASDDPKDCFIIGMYKNQIKSGSHDPSKKWDPVRWKEFVERMGDTYGKYCINPTGVDKFLEKNQPEFEDESSS